MSAGWVSPRGLSGRWRGWGLRGGEGFREGHLKTEGFPGWRAGPGVEKEYGGW